MHRFRLFGVIVMKHIKIVFLLAALWFISPIESANAACTGGTCFGIATGNWGTIGTWSATTGGLTCACTPAAGDNIVFDSGSNGKTFTIDAAYSLASLVGSGGSTATISFGGFTVTITGSTFTLLSTMSVTGLTSTRILAFNPASGTLTVTTGGLTFAGAVTINAPGATVLAGDNWTTLSTGNGITLTAGTFNANGFNISSPSVLGTNSNTRVLTMGSGTWTISGNLSTQWDFTTLTGLTLNANTSTLLFTSADTTGRTANFGANTYNIVTLANTAANSAAPFTIAGGPTIGTLNLTGPVFAKFTTGTTTTVTNFNAAGTSSNEIAIGTSSTSGVAATIAMTSTNIPSISWAGIYGMTFTGTSAPFAVANSFNLRGNTGLTISAPSGGGGGGHVIGGGI